MKPLLLAIGLVLAGGSPAPAGDAVVLVQETRTPEVGKKKGVRHVALLKNTSGERVGAVRVTVELYDYFGKLLWARTVIPAPSSLKPGDTATLSIVTPLLEAHRKTRYRFDYQTAARSR